MSGYVNVVPVTTRTKSTTIGTKENINDSINNTTTTQYEVVGHEGIEIEFHIWMVCSITFIGVAFYTFATLTRFLCRVKFFSFSRDKNVLNPQKKCRSGGTVLNALTFAANFTYIIFTSMDLPLYLGNLKNPYCSHYHRTKILCAGIILFSVYFALWYRVYVIFYINPLFQNTASRFSKYVTNLAPFILASLTVANMIIFLTSPLYETTSIGCRKVRIVEKSVLKWLLLLGTTTFFQALLLFSLIYPLNLHRKQMLAEGVESKSTIPFIKRAAIMAAIVVISDIINALYALLTDHHFIFLSNIAHDTNIFINLTALLFSFPDWRRKLLPCFTDRVEQHRNSLSTTVGQNAQSSFLQRKSVISLVVKF